VRIYPLAEPVLDVTDDLLLGGRIRLRQPASGYRVAIDPILLAASIAAKPGERILDMGSGVGAASLCVLSRSAGVTATLWEIEPAIAALARENAARNGFDDRMIVETRAVGTTTPDFDQVMSNPPYHGGKTSDLRQAATRGVATIEVDLAHWIASAASALRHRGRLTLIFRADRLDELLAALTPKFGGIVLCPLWPRQGEPAKRVIVRAIKGSKAALSLTAGLVLHAAEGYTASAAAILSGDAPLEF
jgi:tRNA1(Val) A37 N6-methylase TrmN6